jgi:hypothetical protein
MSETNFETNLWVAVTPGHTYGPFLSQEQAAATPAAHLPQTVVRLATEADMAAIYAQEDEEDEMNGEQA